MDYFLMNEYVFKLIVKNKKEFILKLLNSLNINIKDYELFDIDIKSNETKVDILLITNDLIINIELNKNKKSLNRNKIYIELLNKILSNYKLIQININLFKAKDSKNIINCYNNNEYINFITSKDYNSFTTNNRIIKKVIQYLNKIDKDKIKDIIKKEQLIKNKLDNLLQ